MQPLASEDPSCIGPYRLLGRLGAGGMGRVYLARRTASSDDGSDTGGETVAVKLVRPELAELDNFRGRFRREVRAARSVDGHWTAAVLDADTEADIPWVATAYVPGPTLQSVVRSDFGPLPSASAHVLANRMGLALTAIHDARLVHRDLKPSNVLLTVDGPRVIDFGIAHALDASSDSTMTPQGVLIGSPEFMSPEQVRGDRVTPASDVFSLGLVLAYAATGRSPFAGGGSGVHAMLFRIAYEEPELDGIPEALADLVRDCLAKNPQERPSVPDVVALTRRAPAGAWLPPALLARLDKAAARPVPTVPHRLDQAAGEPEDAVGHPDFPHLPESLAAAPPPDPLDAPGARITPPRVLRPPEPRRTRVKRRAMASVVTLAALASLVLGGYLVFDTAGTLTGGDRSDSADENPHDYRSTFAGVWKNTYYDPEGFSPMVRLDLVRGARTGEKGAVFVFATKDAICTGELAVVGRQGNMLTLGQHTLYRTVPAKAPLSDCDLPKRVPLRATSADSVEWDRGDSEVEVVRAEEGAADVPAAYTGDWRSADGRWSVTVQRGSYGIAMITGTEQVPGGRCSWSAVVLDRASQQLGTTINQLRRSSSGLDCRTTRDPYTYTTESGRLVLVGDMNHRTELSRA